MSTILEKITQKQDIEKLAQYVMKNPDEIEVLIHEMRTNPKVIKYACEKVLRKISEEKPDRLILILISLQNYWITITAS